MDNTKEYEEFNIGSECDTSPEIAKVIISSDMQQIGVRR